MRYMNLVTAQRDGPPKDMMEDKMTFADLLVLWLLFIGFIIASLALPDTTPPNVSGFSPTGSLNSGTTSTAISWSTDEIAICKWDTSDQIAPTEMGGENMMTIEFYYKHMKEWNMMGMTLPENIIGDLAAYLANGTEPDIYLKGVLSNDLKSAVSTATMEQLNSIGIIAKYIYEFAPPFSFGTKEKVDKWLKSHMLPLSNSGCEIW